MHLIKVLGVTLAHLCLTTSATTVAYAQVYKNTDCSGDWSTIELVSGGEQTHCFVDAGQSIGNIYYDPDEVSGGYAETWSESSCEGSNVQITAPSSSNSDCHSIPFGAVELWYE